MTAYIHKLVVRLADRILCLVGIHDWREMNGRCRECGKRDKYQ